LAQHGKSFWLTGGCVELIKNSSQYWNFVRELRNRTKENFTQQEHITEIQQTKYMLKYNNNYWICLIDKEPVGYVGVIDNDIRVATSPEYQECGVGSFMINEIMKLFPDAVAKVKLDNKASLQLFRKCGFKEKYYILDKI
jgi:RimJ/RimL family protein N-acetyltransferase